MRAADKPDKLPIVTKNTSFGVISVALLSYLIISSVAGLFSDAGLSIYSNHKHAAANLLLFIIFAWIAAIHAKSTDKKRLTLEKSVSRLSLLGETSQRLQACRSVQEVCTVAHNQFRHLLPDTSGALYLMNEPRDQLEKAMAWGEIADEEDRFAPDDCWALRRGRPHQATKEDGAVACRHGDAGKGHWHACLPLTAHGESLGVLLISGHDAAGADIACDSRGPDKQARYCDKVAETLGLAIANLRVRESLRMQAIRDPLTQLFNRRYFLETLPRELNRIARAQEPLSLVMLDIDHFKQFNDSYGHSAGDAVLRVVGQVLNERTRLADIACRYGGEEFALAFPGMSAEAAVRRTEAIRQQIESLTVVHEGRSLQQVTISAGISVFPSDAGDTESLVNSADQALYRSKKRGRNCVSLTASPPPTTDIDPSGRIHSSEEDDGRTGPHDKVTNLVDHRRARLTA